MLNEKVFPAVLGTFPHRFVNGSFQRLWWAQDGAPAHRTAEVREWLTEFLEGIPGLSGELLMRRVNLCAENDGHHIKG